MMMIFTSIWIIYQYCCETIIVIKDFLAIFKKFINLMSKMSESHMFALKT